MSDIDPQITALEGQLEEKGFKKADLGRLLGLDSSQVTRIFKGGRRLQMHEWRKIGEWLGRPPASVSDASVAFLPGVIPLYGWAGASNQEGRITMADQTLLGSVNMHPNQVNMVGAFAVQIIGDSMYPRYRDGEIAYLAPHRRPSREQDCLVETVDGFGYLKEFVKQTGGKVILRQLNPEGEVELDAEKIKAIHAVVGRG